MIGAGIVGLAAAYTMQQRGLSVTVYESGQPGGAQSAGQSRLFRHAHDDTRMIELAIRARGIWSRWEREFGIELISPDGAVMLGDAVSRRLSELGRFELDARRIDSRELAQRIPVLAPYDGPAMLDPDGGSIRTRAAITALLERLSAAIVPEQVISIDQSGEGVAVLSATGCRRFRTAVICAGRGGPALAGTVGLSIPVSVSAHTRVSFRVRGAAPPRLAGLQDGGALLPSGWAYATAYPDRRTYALGLGSVELSDDDTSLDGKAVGELVDHAAEYAARALPGLDPSPAGFVHCWVTRLPWGDDGIGIWQADDVFVLAGNNMFKHAPALGAVLADCVGDGAVPQAFRPEAALGAAATS